MYCDNSSGKAAKETVRPKIYIEPSQNRGEYFGFEPWEENYALL